MSEACLKLTAYVGERRRARTGGFVADAMLDLFGARDVATSVMLRGSAGFGPSHVLRSDQSLTLSEDPPVAIAAVDTEPKVRALFDDVVAMTGSGLVTLERARLLRPGDTVDDIAEHDTAKLTVYVGRQQRIDGVSAHYAICDRLSRHGFAGATVLLGVDGTAHGRRYRARFFSRNVDVPVMILAIGTLARISTVLGELAALAPQALVTVERVQVCKQGGDLLARPRPPTPQSPPLFAKLMVHTEESDLHEGQPIHRALITGLRQAGVVRGATVLRGIWGFHGERKPHGDRLFQLARRVPVTTIIVDTPQAVAAGFDIVDELTNRHGLVTSETVAAVRSVGG